MGYILAIIFSVMNIVGLLNVDWVAIIICMLFNFVVDVYSFKNHRAGGY